MTSRRKTIGFFAAAAALSGAALVGSVGVASAHDFEGGGTCEGWDVHLDGLYGAHHIILNGYSVDPQTDYFYPDTSDLETLTVTITWDKDSGDVTKTHTLTRDTSDCEPETPPTTTPEAPPTTVAPPTEPPTLIPPTVIERPNAPAPTPVVDTPSFTG